MFASQTKHLFETPHALVFERKLDTALRQTTLDCFKERLIYNKCTLDDKLILMHYSKFEIELFKYENIVYPLILQKLLNKSLNGTILGNIKSRNTYNRRYEARCDIFRHSINSLLIKYELPNKSKILAGMHKFLEENNESIFVQNLLCILKEMNKLVEITNRMHKYSTRNMEEDDYLHRVCRINKYDCPFGLANYKWSSRLLSIDINNDTYIMPRHYLLLIHNKLSDLTSLLVFSRSCAQSIFPSDMENLLIEFIQIIIKLALKYKNKVFTIMKTLESIVIAENLADIESWPNSEFLENTVNDLKQDIGFDYYNSELEQFLHYQIPIVRQEFGCLSKLIGHPLVNMKTGAENIQKKTNIQHEIDPNIMTLACCHLKQSYIKNHILKHGIWPPCEINSLSCPEYLTLSRQKNIDPGSPEIRTRFPTQNIEHYIFIDILPNLRFDYLENCIPYLKDKTISVFKSKVTEKFLEKSNNGVIPWQETRQLLYYLCNINEVTDHVKYMKKIEQDINILDRDLLEEYMVLRIVPKEKELKIDFRGFGCQTFLNRMKCTAQEKAVANYLDMYCDEHAMTLTELDLIKKMYAIRTITKAYKRHRALMINIDASSWNNMFRQETVEPILKETLDKIYNTNIISNTHLFFQKILYYVPDEHDTYFWHGQAGGIEGQNQYTWVTCYINQIKVAMKGLGYKYHILCKGDDLRLIALIPPSIAAVNDMSKIKNDLTTRVSEVALKFGHKIKVVDSYGSEAFLSFGKFPSIGTVELSQAYRKIQKTYGATNAFLPTLDEYIGSTFSNAHSTARVLPHPLVPFWISLFWSTWYITLHEKYKNLSIDEIVAIHFVPSILGGFPIIFLSNFFVRSESDLLAPFIAIYQYFSKYNFQIKTILENFMVVPYNRNSDFRSIKNLCKDPYSIPNDRPTLPTSLLRAQILPSLRRLIKNKDILNLIEASKSDLTNKVLEALYSANVYNSKVFSTTYSATPDGLIDEVLKKFESARSVHEILILRGGKRFSNKVLRKVIKAEEDLQNWRYKRIKGINMDRVESFISCLTSCPTESTQKIRHFSWGKPVEGITNPPVCHQIRLTTGLTSSQIHWDTDNHFTLTHYYPKRYIMGARDIYAWGSAGCTPFLGHKTSSSSTIPSIHFIEKDVLLSKIRNLLELDNWTNIMEIKDGVTLHSNYISIIKSVLKLYVNEPYEALNKFASKRKSGTAHHHLASRGFRQTIIPNSLSNIYQNFVGTLHTHNRLKDSTGHFYMNFLNIYCHSIATLTMQLAFETNVDLPTDIWIVTDKCEFCNQMIKETPIIIDSSLVPNENDYPVQSTRIAKISYEKLMRALDDYNSKDHKYIAPTENLPTDLASYGLIQEFLHSVIQSRERIIDATSQHTVSEEGFSVLQALLPHYKGSNFSKHELNLISYPHLFWSLCAFIIYDINNLYGYINDEILSSLHHTHPITSFTWYHVLSYLNANGNLSSFIRYIANETKISQGTSSINIHHATHYLLHVVGKLNYQFSTTIPFIYMRCYHITTAFNKLKRIYFINLRNYLFKYSLKYLETINELSKMNLLRDTDIDYVLETLTHVFCLYSYDYTAKEELHELLRTADIQNITEIRFLTTPNNISLEDIYDIKEDREYNGFNVLYKLTNLLPWNLIVDNTGELLYPHNYMIYKDDLINIFNQYSMPFACSTIEDCITILQNQQELLEQEQLEISDESSCSSKPDIFITDINNTLILHPKIIPKTAYHIHRYDVSISGKTVFDYTTPELQLFPEEPSLLLMESDFLKYYGESTISMTRMVELFHYLGLTQASYGPQFCTIFGDGLGGTSTFVCHLFPKSHIKLMTLKETQGQLGVPIMTENAAKINECFIDTSEFDLDMTDITKQSTLNKLLEENRLTSLVISDIEPIGRGRDRNMSYLNNVILYYLRCRTVEGILIFQIRLQFYIESCNLINFLYNYCTHIYLFQPPSSYNGGMMYVVAYGHRCEFLGDLQILNLPISNPMYIFLINIYNTAVDKLSKIYSSIDHTYIYYTDVKNIYTKWVDRLPPYFITAIQQKLKILIDINTINNNILNIPGINNIIAKSIPYDCYILRDKSIMYFENSELYRRNYNPIDPELDINTRAFAEKMYMNYLMSQGFLDICCYSADHFVSFVITNNIIRQWYLDIIQTSHNRLKIDKDSADMFTRNSLTIDNIPERYFSSYLTGIRLGIALISYISISYTFHNSKNEQIYEEQPIDSD
nr:MAG: RNA-dependent RNA polymerase [Bat faecal associated chuvirus 1]